jgi:hypothetical protein
MNNRPNSKTQWYDDNRLATSTPPGDQSKGRGDLERGLSQAIDRSLDAISTKLRASLSRRKKIKTSEMLDAQA